ncbi:MAG: hypothetical protein M3Z25_07950 [Actinomycetota bacterium]|nr:hypothetical protein [Actinomycetota bacterium]
MSLPTISESRAPKGRRAAALIATAAAAGLLLTGCGSSGSDDAKGLLLSGPNTNIVVTIPAGWHQVINAANPMIPEMVAPTTCMGSDEIACSSGLARIATITAKNIQEATNAVQAAVTGATGVTDVTTVSKGPGKLGKRDGFLHRFTFKNPGATLTSEIAAVPSGPTTPDKEGNLEYSVVLVWISNKPDAPKVDDIDTIVNSTLVHGGVSAP